MCGCSAFASDKIVLGNTVFWLGSAHLNFRRKSEKFQLEFLVYKTRVLLPPSYMYIYAHVYIYSCGIYYANKEK